MCRIDLQKGHSFFSCIGQRLIKVEGRWTLLQVYLAKYVNAFPVNIHLCLGDELMCLLQDVPVVCESRVAEEGWVRWSSEEVTDVFGVFAQDYHGGKGGVAQV